MWFTNLFGKVKNISSEIVKNKNKKKRLSTCQKCTNYRKDFKMFFQTKKNEPQCKVCKCALKSKTIWEDEKCPKNKW